jgi:hypothetical protein
LTKPHGVISLASTSIEEWKHGPRIFSPHLPTFKTRSVQHGAGFLLPEIHYIESTQHHEITFVVGYDPFHSCTSEARRQHCIQQPLPAQLMEGKIGVNPVRH